MSRACSGRIVELSPRIGGPTREPPRGHISGSPWSNAVIEVDWVDLRVGPALPDEMAVPLEDRLRSGEDEAHRSRGTILARSPITARSDQVKPGHGTLATKPAVGAARRSQDPSRNCPFFVRGGTRVLDEPSGRRRNGSRARGIAEILVPGQAVAGRADPSGIGPVWTGRSVPTGGVLRWDAVLMDVQLSYGSI